MIPPVRSIRKLILLGGTLVVLPLAAAGAAAAGASAPKDGKAPAHDVRSWLLRIHEAAGHRNFQGTFVVSGGGAVSSARIVHYCEGPHQFERSESLDGPPRTMFRHDDVVHTVWPASKVAVVEQRDQITSFPSLLQAGDDRLADHYEVQPLERDRVAGRDADVLLVKPKDALRYGYRLWADHASGLLLRADVLGERGNVLETSAFSEVSIDVRPQPEQVVKAMKKLEGYRVVRPSLTPTTLADEGWVLKAAVPGFRQVSCVRRPMDLPTLGDNVSPPEQPRSPVLQAIWSDGLTYVSVFIEPYDASRHLRQLATAVGPTQTLMQQQGSWWITVIGDVPQTTLRQFANGLVRKN